MDMPSEFVKQVGSDRTALKNLSSCKLPLSFIANLDERVNCDALLNSFSIDENLLKKSL